TAPFTLELDDASKLYPGTDPVQLTVLWHPHPRLSSRTVDPYLDQVRIPPLYKDVCRDIVDHSSVDITPAVLHGLVLESQEICACQKKIFQLSLWDLLYAQLQFLQISQRKSHDTEFFPAVPDLLLIHILMDQLPQGTHLHTAVPQAFPQFRDDIRTHLYSAETPLT